MNPEQLRVHNATVRATLQSLFDTERSEELRVLLPDGSMQMGRFSTSASVIGALKAIGEFKGAYVVLNRVK